MQISNASVPFPNAVAPFSPKVDQPSSGVTKDILASSFSPLDESQPLAPSKNSLNQQSVVYSPQSLVQSASTQAAPTVAPKITPKSDANNDQLPETGSIEPSAKKEQITPDAENIVARPNGENSDQSPVSGNVSGDIDATSEDVDGSQATNNDSTAEAAPLAGLTPEEQAIIGELAARDREVRTHEQQHQAVGGQYAGAASYSYQTGPDGVQYAIGGEVSIDISAVPNNPQATIDKMRTVKNAALAPAEPSAQDRSVASSATRIMMQAQTELAEQQAEELQVIRAEAQQNQAEAAEAREQQQDEQENNNPSVSEGVRTYESLIGLGQQFENGLSPNINLDEVV